MKIKQSLRDFIFPFLLGFFIKEFVTFVQENGFDEAHKLARSLFGMIACSAALIFLWFNEQIELLKALLGSNFELLVSLIKKKLEERNNAPENINAH
jgi:hypothetical protein